MEDKGIVRIKQNGRIILEERIVPKEDGATERKKKSLDPHLEICGKTGQLKDRSRKKKKTGLGKIVPGKERRGNRRQFSKILFEGIRQIFSRQDSKERKEIYSV